MFFSKQTSPGPVEFIIAGLGNPGREYEGTRHNAGFLAVDRLADRLGAQVGRVRFKGVTGAASLGGPLCAAAQARHLYEPERPVRPGGHGLL